MMKNERLKGIVIKILIWLAVAAVVLLVVILGVLTPREELSEEVEVPPALVRVIEVSPRTVRETVLLPGRVEANVSARLSAEKGGRVISLRADRGDNVKAGDVLMQIDDRHWQALERQARLDLEDAERDFERWKQMKESGAVAASEFDAFRLRRDRAVVNLEQAAVHLQQCTVTSPFDGVVDARWVEAGEYVNEGQSVFSILDLSPLKVHVKLPERDVMAVQKGDAKKMTAPTLSGKTIAARMGFIAQEADARTLTYAAELIIEDPPEGLRPGMLVDVEIERSQKEGAIAVPLAAVIPRRGENIVFVVENGRAVRRVVVMESIAGREALIGGGLQAGERLIIEGHRTLQDGMAVEEAGQE